MNPEVETVTPEGLLNDAAVPMPLTREAAPLPAIVATPAVIVIERIRLLFVSATTSFPDESIVTAWGPLNEAATPIPSAQEAEPLPAKVESTPLEKTAIRLLVASAIKRLEFVAYSPYGCARPVETNVETTPADKTRIRLLFVSLIYVLFPVAATPQGKLNVAALDTPSVAPVVPVPASLIIFQ